MNVRDQKDDFAKNAKPLLKYSLLSLGTPILASNVDIYTIEDVSSKTCAPAKSIKLSDRSISSDIIRAYWSFDTSIIIEMEHLPVEKKQKKNADLSKLTYLLLWFRQIQ